MRDGIIPFYLRSEVATALRKELQEKKHIAVGEFLTREELRETKRLCAGGWMRSSVPDRHSFDERGPLIVNARIAAFVKMLSGRNPLPRVNRRFGRGDYTILHDKDKPRSGIVAFYFLDGWNASWGGDAVFVKNGKTLLRFTPRQNTLLLVDCDKGVRHFVKYINHRAKRRLTVLG